MNKNEKDFMNELTNLDDFSVEEIAENYPSLNKKAKKRILKKCMKKHNFSTETDYDGEEKNTISGTERYNRNIWYKFAASAAAFVIAVGGITGVFMLNRNLNGNDISETEITPVISFPDQSNEGISEKASDTTDNKPISLSGTNWFKHEDNGPTEKEIEFNNDGVNGYYIIYPENVITTESTKIPFTYEQNGYDVNFCMGSDDTVTAKLSIDDWYVTLTIEWQDGHKECFYNYDIINTSSDNGNENDNSEIPPADKESSVNNSDNSVPKNSTPTTPTQNAASATPAQNNTPTAPAQNDTPATPEQSNPPEVQKTYLNELYFVEIPDGYMVFNFCLDGTFSKYDINADFGTEIYNSYITSNYEIVGDKISFGDLNTVFHKKTGTVIKLDDLNNFNVKFDDGEIINFTNEPPTFKNNPIFMSGTYWINLNDDGPVEKAIEFAKDGSSGNYIIFPENILTTDATKIPFTFEQYEYDLAFHLDSENTPIMAKLSVADWRVILTLEWSDGHTEYFWTSDDNVMSYITP